MEDIIKLPQMSFSESVKTVLSKLTDFNGRARRSELWWFWLVYAVVSFMANMLISGMHTLSLIVSMLLLLSVCSVTVRRLHDRGHHGWWVISSVIINIFYNIYMLATGYLDSLSTINPDPQVATKIMSDPMVIMPVILLCVLNICILVFCLLDSKPEANKYGPSPKYITNSPEDAEMQ